MIVETLETLVSEKQDRRIKFRDVLSSGEKTELELEIIDLLHRLRKERFRANAHRLPAGLLRALNRRATPDWPFDHHLEDLLTSKFWPATLAETNDRRWISFPLNAVNQLRNCGLSAVGIAQLEEDCNLRRYLRFNDLPQDKTSENARRSDARIRKIRSLATRFMRDLQATGEADLFEDLASESHFDHLYAFLTRLVAEADAAISTKRQAKIPVKIPRYNTKGKGAILVITEFCVNQRIKISGTPRSRFKRIVEICFEVMLFPGNVEYEIDRLIAHRRAVGISSTTARRTPGGRKSPR